MNTAAKEMLRKKVHEMGTLPAMPTVLRSLGETLSQAPEKVNIERVVELISYDKSLAAQCLRVSNSALFAGRAEVGSVREAVRALGLSRVRDLVYACSLPGLFSNAKEGMAATTFWRHALGTALISQLLAQRLGMENPEKLYLAGLLHDMGILVNALLFKEKFSEVLRAAESSEMPLWEVELEVLGFTHCESGRVLADIWKLPAEISKVMEGHHQPELCGADAEITSIVYLADVLCRLRGMGYGYYEAREFELAGEPVWQILAKKFPAAGELDVERFTYELDVWAQHVQEMVESILSGAPAKV